LQGYWSNFDPIADIFARFEYEGKASPYRSYLGLPAPNLRFLFDTPNACSCADEFLFLFSG